MLYIKVGVNIMVNSDGHFDQHAIFLLRAWYLKTYLTYIFFQSMNFTTDPLWKFRSITGIFETQPMLSVDPNLP